MYNKKSIEKVEKSIFEGPFKKVVNDYCLSNIPGTILNNFGISSEKQLPVDVFGSKYKKFDKVVLFVVDALGYSAFERYYHHSKFLRKVVKEGVVSKLTTQFPSTTTANVTTFHSGIPVSQSGVIEWFYYEPLIDAVYSPLLFKKAKEDDILTVEASSLLPNKNLYQKLNVASYVFQYHLYNEGPFGKQMQKGSQSIGFKNLEDGLNQLKKVLQKDEKSYSYFYHSDFDSISHQYGPNALETEESFISIFKSFDQFFEDVSKMDFKNTLFLLTADHGQTTVIKENAVYINLEYPEILPYLKKNKAGEYIIPCGSFRDLFLHVEKDHIDYVCAFLKEKLDGKAEVYPVKEIIQAGIFGEEKPSQKFLERVGDIVILAYQDQAIWWYEEDKFYVHHLGMHGGLTKEELEIPFLVYPCE
ncbi:alkaline phosphatase family protein [Mycoplasmatota bacterium]|nr:alkaline phosphatase family protein [Mycoplasmatota bacterium]